MAPDRQKHSERKKGVAVEKDEMKKLSNESQKGVPLYVRTSFLPLLPSRQSHLSLYTFADTPSLCQKNKKYGQAICVRGHCGLTLDALLRVAVCKKTKQA